MNSRIIFRWDFFETNLKKSKFSCFNQKVPLATYKKIDDMSKKLIQSFAILFAKDVRLNLKL